MKEKDLEIILIDDSPEDTDMALRTLGNFLGNRVLSFENGPTAFDYLAEQGSNVPRLILLDLNMPKINGLEFIRKLKDNAQLCNIPIAVLTGSTDFPDIAESLKLGVKCYIAKPIEPEDIIRMETELGLSLIRLNK